MPRIRRKASSGFSLLGRRPPDEDEQLLQARFELTRLETQYIEAAKAVDKLSQTRKGKPSRQMSYLMANTISQQCLLLMPTWEINS